MIPVKFKLNIQNRALSSQNFTKLFMALLKIEISSCIPYPHTHLFFETRSDHYSIRISR